MKQQYAIVKVENNDLKYGTLIGVTLKEAQDSYIKGFITNAKKKQHTKYRNYKGIEFQFY